MQCFINSFSEGLRKEYADKGIIVQVCNQRLICSKIVNISCWIIWHLALLFTIKEICYTQLELTVLFQKNSALLIIWHPSLNDRK